MDLPDPDGDRNPSSSSKVCRACLTQTMDLLSVNESLKKNADVDFGNVTHLDCLTYCLGTKIDTSLPAYMCLECSSALNVAYVFMRNAFNAQEAFKSQQMPVDENEDTISSPIQKEAKSETSPLTCSYHCRFCDEELLNGIYLSDHMKLHSEAISYSCSICKYENRDADNLQQHYVSAHGIHTYRDDLDFSANSYASITDDLKAPSAPSDPNTSNVFQLAEALAGCSVQSSTAPLIHPKDINYQTILKKDGGVEKLISESGKRRDSFLQEVAVPFEKVCSYNPNKKATTTTATTTEAKSESATGSNEDVIMPPAPEAEELPIVEAEQAETTFSQQFHTLQDLPQVNANDLITSESVDQPKPQTGASSITIGGNSVALQETTPTAITKLPIKICCSVCPLSFTSQADLEKHMLTHQQDDLQFLCDRCPYIAISVNELNQHYESKHNSTIANKQFQLISQPEQFQHNVELQSEQQLQQELEKVQQQQQQQPQIVSKVQVTQKRRKPLEETEQSFSCDKCVYESDNKTDLKYHYLFKHCVQASEVQLRPMVVDSKMAHIQAAQPKQQPLPRVTIAKTLNMNALRCPKCIKIFPSPHELYQHFMRVHTDQQAQQQSHQCFYDIKTGKIFTTKTPALNNCQFIRPTTAITMPATTIATATGQQPVLRYESLLIKPLSVVETSNAAAPNVTTTTTAGSTASDYINFQDLVDTVFSADDETDTTPAAAGEHDDSTQMQTQTATNEDFEDLVLTSDNGDSDDSDDDYNDNLPGTSKPTTKSAKTKKRYCVHCHKFFRTQYTFENHMFVHRGLKPFRCTLCNNVFNTKRILIQHYRGVHDCIPNRDMIQAKGHKVTDDSRAAEITKSHIQMLRNSDHIDMQFVTEKNMMCASCPFESDYYGKITSHLNTVHAVTGESHILYKLPLQCTRCIRTYSSKLRLIRHLSFNHSTLSIKQAQPLRGKLTKQQTRRKQSQQQQQPPLPLRCSPRFKKAPTSAMQTPPRNRGKTKKLNMTI